MKYSKSEAARRVGINRKTLDKHIKEKGISVEQDFNGNPLIDASELIRVYGDRFKPEDAPQVTPEQGTAKVAAVPIPNAAVDIAVLKEKLDNMEAQRDQFEKLYDQERAERQGNQKLLTDQREKQNTWERSFEQLRQQVVEQDRTAQQELDEFKKDTTEKLMRYRKALQAERNKSVWQRLFPNRKTGQGG